MKIILGIMALFFCAEAGAQWGRPPTRAEVDSLLEVAAEAEQLGFETDKHVHGREQWFGRHATQAGNNWALPDTLGAFQLTAGTDMAWGDTLKILGPSDTPYRSGMTKFDLHRVMLSYTSSDSLYAMRVIYGTTNASAAVAAKEYSVIYFKSDATNPQQSSAAVPIEFMMPRCAAGTKVWAQVKCRVNSATVRVLFGLHEYLR